MRENKTNSIKISAITKSKPSVRKMVGAARITISRNGTNNTKIKMMFSGRRKCRKRFGNSTKTMLKRRKMHGNNAERREASIISARWKEDFITKNRHQNTSSGIARLLCKRRHGSGGIARPLQRAPGAEMSPVSSNRARTFCVLGSDIRYGKQNQELQGVTNDPQSAFEEIPIKTFAKVVADKKTRSRKKTKTHWEACQVPVR